MKIYMDACCLNRPFDDMAQDRVRVEADVITDILLRCRLGEWMLAASAAIDYELDQIVDLEKRMKVEELYALAAHRLPMTDQVISRAEDIHRQEFSFWDSAHLAFAEIFRQDIFLTTDDKLLRRSKQISLQLQIANPVIWFMEIT
jgi:predicted nucleic acid-binding protein